MEPCDVRDDDQANTNIAAYKLLNESRDNFNV